MKKINIGLDLGIASVGWAVVNAEDFEILDAGARLFPEANKEGENTAATRREKRSIRRMTRRRWLRSNDLKNLFVKYGMLKNPEVFERLTNKRFPTLIELKCYALESPIELEEMMLILFSTLKKRGSFNLKEDFLEDAKNQELSSEELEQLIKEQDRKLPCLIQLENLKNKNKVVGSDNKFSHEMYKTELKKIIEKQQQFQSFNLNDNFINEYFELFDRKRQYFEGPSGDSPFGWNGDEEEFYKRLIGQDTYALDQNRTAKKGMYAALFNLLNDLNQIEIDAENREGKKITKIEKETIIKNLFASLPSKNKNLTLKTLAKSLNVDEDKISGYRIDKDNKPNFTKFEGLNDLYNKLTKSSLDTSWLIYENLELIDQVLNLLTKYQSVESSKQILTELFKNHKFANYEKIAEVISLMTKNYNGSHALSNKTILEVLPFMWDEPKMSQTIFTEQGKKKQYKFQFNNSLKYLPVLKEEINSLFISPVVKRTLIQALKVLKAIQIEYRDYQIDSVVIEMARENNSEDTRKALTKFQKENDQIRSDIKEFLLAENAKTNNEKLIKKVYLAMEQNFKCVYCLGSIEIDLLTHNENAYEIDHIIPESISFNTKKENLVLVHGSENHEKRNQTAYQYINSNKSKLSWAQFVARIDEVYNDSKIVKKNSKYLQRKKANLKDDTNFNDPEKRLEFINRNLNDTRYSTSEVRTYLEEFRKNNEFNNYKLKTLNGKYTDFIKKEIFVLPRKDRDDFKHHAIDAITIAYSDIIKQKIFKDKTTDYVKQEYGKFANEIQNFDFKFSKKANQNFNKQLANDTLYSFKKHNGEFRQMNKIPLFSDNLKILDKIFLTKEIETLLGIYDQKTFTYLEEIYKKYPKGMPYQDGDKEFTVKNPFIYFSKILNQKITLQKNIKNPELNPEIKTLKYYGDNIGRILEITHKYSVDTEKIKIGFTSLKPIRIDLYQHKITKSYKVFPVNANVISKINEKEIIINQAKYNELIEDKKGYNINLNEYEKVMELFPRGSLIRITSKNGKYNNDIFEIVGSPNIGKIEVDYYKKRRKLEEEPARLIIAVATLAKIEKVHSNILGNKLKFIENENFLDRMKVCVR